MSCILASYTQVESSKLRKLNSKVCGYTHRHIMHINTQYVSLATICRAIVQGDSVVHRCVESCFCNIIACIQVYAYIHIDIRTQRVARCLEMPPRVSYTVELKCFTYVFRSPYEVVCLQDHAVMRRQQNASAAKFSSIIRLSAGVCRELVVCDTDKTVSNNLRKSCILHTQSIVSNQGKRLL